MRRKENGVETGTQLVSSGVEPASRHLFSAGSVSSAGGGIEKRDRSDIGKMENGRPCLSIP